MPSRKKRAGRGKAGASPARSRSAASGQGARKTTKKTKTGEKSKRSERSRAPEATKSPPRGRKRDRAFTVVGVGASAGGLEAARELLRNIPGDADLCLILVAHLSPDQKSMMPELLSRVAKLSVVEASEGRQLQRGCVYVIPPGRMLEVVDGSLHMVRRPQGALSMPIDHLFRSLARSYAHSVGVVLSGTASDGARGLREIKEVGGIAIAQDPESAAYSGMPRAAIDTGVVDLVLSPEAIGRELVRIARDAGTTAASELMSSHSEGIRRLFALLRKATGVDFSGYKRPTIQRRVQRRMLLHRAGSLEEYLKLLEKQPAEVTHLGRDLLIQVTSFFREPEAFEALTKEVFPRILERKEPDEPVRIWVAGMASGEEAYSVAIALMEQVSERKLQVPVQIFATDVSEEAIGRARAGLYPVTIAADVSEERLRRFFSKVDGGYRVSPTVREVCVFARQDLTRDPPFSKIDLVVCRNLLIYLETAVQQKVIRIFHYALQPEGYLLLGDAETVGAHGDLFAIADKRYRLYTKRQVATPSGFDLARPLAPGATVGPSPEKQEDATGLREALRILIDRFAAPGVLVDLGSLQIVETFGRTARYLELSPGSPSLNVLKMAREGLGLALRRAIEECRRTGRPASSSPVRLREDEAALRVVVHARLIGRSSGQPSRALVVFDETEHKREKAEAEPRRRRSAASKTSESQRIRELEAELEASRAHMQAMIQDLEAANEELQSANEEVLSSNEELQSTNEELDTAREELQSTNEEINTVNEELQGRNEELLRVNSDLENLLSNVQLGVVIVSHDRRIRLFTPPAGRLLNLIPSDIGRPIGQIKPVIEFAELDERIREVVDTVVPYENEVRDARGGWLSLRIRPYKDLQNRIDGAVLSLVDVTELKSQELEAHAARELADATLDTVGDGLLVVNERMEVQRANPSFCELLEVKAQVLVGHSLLDAGDGRGRFAELRRVLEQVIQDGKSFDEEMVTLEVPGRGVRNLAVRARRIAPAPGEAQILLNVRLPDPRET